MSMLLTATAVVAVLYILVMILVYFMQPRMVYFPARDFDATPDAVGLQYEDITLTTGDNRTVHGWYIPAPNASATILFCHGNAGNISHRMQSFLQFHSIGVSVFIFDYPGYGRSEGRPDEQGTYDAAEAAWQFLTGSKHIAPEKIVIFGRSLGGAVAVWLAARHDVGAVIIESSFTSLPDIAASYYRFLPVRFLARFKYPSIDRLANIHAPILIVHSPDDELIPYEHGRRLYESAPEPKQFLKISGSHNDGHVASDSMYTAALKEFINRYITK